MMTVGDERGREEILRKLTPERIWVSVELQRNSIAQVSRQASTRPYRSFNLALRCMRMPQRDMHATMHQSGNVRFGLIIMRGNCHHADQAVAGRLPPLEFTQAWRPDR
jgi:hypothetical protein